jgi:2-oxoisovalerate dehydrogenase E1 component
LNSVVEDMRESRRPGMLVIDTGRMGPHSKGDDLRDVDERDEITASDPLKALRARCSAEDVEAIESTCQDLPGGSRKSGDGITPGQFRSDPRALLQASPAT